MILFLECNHRLQSLLLLNYFFGNYLASLVTIKCSFSIILKVHDLATQLGSSRRWDNLDLGVGSGGDGRLDVGGWVWGAGSALDGVGGAGG